jgi:hypothetical protein
VEQRGERDTHLEPGEVHAEADVHAVAEGDVLARRADDVEAVGVGIAVRFPVGRSSIG